MKRIILSAIVAAWFAGMATAQVPPTNDEYNQLLTEWIQINEGNKDAAYAALDGLYERIRTEFPMDPKIAQAVDELRKQGDAAVKAKAAEMGFDEAHFKEAFSPQLNPRYEELHDLQQGFYTQERALTEAYNLEFSRRYQQTCIDAMKRLMENAEALK